MRSASGVAPSTQERIRQAHATFGDAACLLVYYGDGPQVASLDEPCRTITTRDRFALYERGRMRMLQPHELLLLQGFPGEYQLSGTRSQQVMQVGNSVSPPVMCEIVRQAA